jgi:hypothetical protein
LASVVPDPTGHVVVFDFERHREIIAHLFTGFATGFTWHPDGTLDLHWWRHLHGNQTRAVWRAPAPRKRHWWERPFHGA